MSSNSSDDSSDDESTIVDLTGDVPVVTTSTSTSNRGVNWCFTVNNFTSRDEGIIEYVLAPKAKWLCYGKEIAPTSGTPHLQGYAMFTTKQSIGVLKKALPRAHWEKAKGNAQHNYVYCHKDVEDEENQWVEYGVRPEFHENNGKREKIRWDRVLEAAKKRDYENIPPHCMVTSYGNIVRIGKDFATMPDEAVDVTGVWIQGPSGCGKSRKARQDYPGAYIKTCNKWWDMYQDQPFVIMDDMDKSHSVLGHHLKIWADRYGFMAETKGSALAIRPAKFVVTTQYRMEDIWTDTETIEALKRRFTIVDMFPEQVYPIFITPAQPRNTQEDVSEPPRLKRSKGIEELVAALEEEEY